MCDFHYFFLALKLKKKEILSQFIHTINYKNFNVDVLRLDLLQPNIQGNKYYKLKYNIVQARKENKSILLSFGGAYSNHIAALAKLGALEKFTTIGIIRAEEHEDLSYTLKEAEQNGMLFKFCNRTDYRNFRKHLNNNNQEAFGELLKKHLPKVDEKEVYIIPEGGTNSLALKGTQEILDVIEKAYEYICCPVGTAGTISGIIASSKYSNIIGFPALKGNFFEKEINTLLKQISNETYSNWEINSDYHFGAYAAFNNDLISFINRFYSDYAIPLEPIYTAKMFYGIFDMIAKNKFALDSKILAIHTGGLQGIKGFNEKHGDLLNT